MATATETGAVEMTDADYFAHAALSHSDLKLLRRSPAHYRYVKDHDVRTFKPEFDFGHVVHELVLGDGGGIDVIDAKDWRTKAAKESRAASHAAGRAPLLAADYEQAKECAECVSLHPVAAKLLAAAEHKEVALVWDHIIDDGPGRATAVTMKAKLDLITGNIGVDLKTTDYAATEAFARSAARFGYATQDPFYRDALRGALGINDPAFLFVVVERNPPYLVNVIEIAPDDIERGRKHNERDIALYRQCCETNTWPGYGDEINLAELPGWWRWDEDMNDDTDTEETSW